MEKEKGQKMIERLPEGKLRNIRIHIEGEEPELKYCACCICSPEVRGAGDETAKQSGSKLADDVMVVVGSVATEA